MKWRFVMVLLGALAVGPPVLAMGPDSDDSVRVSFDDDGTDFLMESMADASTDAVQHTAQLAIDEAAEAVADEHVGIRTEAWSPGEPLSDELRRIYLDESGGMRATASVVSAAEKPRHVLRC